MDSELRRLRIEEAKAWNEWNQANLDAINLLRSSRQKDDADELDDPVGSIVAADRAWSVLEARMQLSGDHVREATRARYEYLRTRQED